MVLVASACRRELSAAHRGMFTDSSIVLRSLGSSTAIGRRRTSDAFGASPIGRRLERPAQPTEAMLHGAAR